MGVGGGVAVEVGRGVGVGVAVGAGVDVGGAVGVGIDVGAGVAVGFGVGAAVDVGGGVAVGAGVGVGSGEAETLTAVESVKTAEAMTPPSLRLAFPLPAPVDISCTAAIVCAPAVPDGTVMVALNVPLPDTFGAGSPFDDPSQVSWSLVFAGKLEPEIATCVPAAPLPGLIERDGPVAAALRNGTAATTTTTTIATVAAQSRAVAFVGLARPCREGWTQR